MFLDVILDTLVATNRTPLCQDSILSNISPNQCFTFTINALKSHVMRQFNEFLKILFPGSATTKPAVKLNFNIDLTFYRDTIRT